MLAQQVSRSVLAAGNPASVCECATLGRIVCSNLIYIMTPSRRLRRCVNGYVLKYPSTLLFNLDHFTEIGTKTSISISSPTLV